MWYLQKNTELKVSFNSKNSINKNEIRIKKRILNMLNVSNGKK